MALPHCSFARWLCVIEHCKCHGVWFVVEHLDQARVMPSTQGPLSCLLLSNGGMVVMDGHDIATRFEIPSLREGVSIEQCGVSIEQCAAGCGHIVCLLSDGTVFASASGLTLMGECNIPELQGNMKYTQVAAGAHHTVLLRDDGSAVAFGSNNKGPASSYTHIVTIRSRVKVSFVVCTRLLWDGGK